MGPVRTERSKEGKEVGGERGGSVRDDARGQQVSLLFDKLLNFVRNDSEIY